MKVQFTPHADQRLVERSIKRSYVDFALRKGKRENKSHKHGEVDAFRSRCHGLEVIHTYEPFRVVYVLTAYWKKNPTPELFDSLLQAHSKKNTRRTHGQMPKVGKHKTNLSWEFWNDDDYEFFF